MADAQDSKSCEGNFVWVQVPPPALKSLSFDERLFYFCDFRTKQALFFENKKHPFSLKDVLKTILKADNGSRTRLSSLGS